MKRITGSLAALVLLAPSLLPAHEMTEKYIPIGQYATLRSGDTVSGQVSARDDTARTVTITTSIGEREFAVTDRTRIWLDRSHLKQPNLDGSFTDIEPGMETEVRASKADPRQCAWIKVRSSR